MKTNEIKKDLRSLSSLLSTWKNVRNPRILNDISMSEDSSKKIEYSISNSTPLIFTNIDLDRHCIPFGIEKLKRDNIDLEIGLTAFCRESIVDTEFEDPIENLGVNIIIHLLYNKNNEPQEANCSWHIDKGGELEANFSHPIYHMNFGGSHMTKQGDVFGKLLLLPAPRIIHPPMDIVLSCDFIIRNFYKKENHQKITQLPNYIEILNKAKQRYWKPYINAFSSKWNSNIAITNLSFPQIVGHQ